MPEFTKVEFPILAEDKVQEAAVEFIRKMLNRLTIGALRYGRSKTALKQGSDQAPVDMARTAQHRINQFIETGDREHLIDAANYCLLEWRRHEDVPDSPMHSGQNSPGNVRSDNGKITGARGVFEKLNGIQFQAGGITMREPTSVEALQLVIHRLETAEKMARGETI